MQKDLPRIGVASGRSWPALAWRAAGTAWFFAASALHCEWNSVEISEAGMASVIVRDPEILGGRPVFRGTRVPVEVLFENLEDGLSINEIIEAYPSLNKDDVIACLEGACAVLKAA
jgi:uncharacterized protein (DUF433 family)